MKLTDPEKPRVAVTLGDPAGVGPEIAARLLRDSQRTGAAEVVVFSSAAELAAAAARAGVPLDELSHVRVVDLGLSYEGFDRAEPSAAGGRWSLANLEAAMLAARDGEVDGVFFAPLNKTSLHLAGMHENDEMRWMQRLLDFDGVVSELNAIEGLWTARVTSHIPLRDVASGVTADRVAAVTVLLDRYLREAGVPDPRIAVCALNPHGGEGGRFGHEDTDEIQPGVAAAVARGVNAHGPFPCDTLFLRARDGEFDGVVSMYHDQGQIATKLLGFDQGVTVEGGLPFPVCTPAHGTAYGIVGTGEVRSGAAERAFDLTTVLGRAARERATVR